MATKIPLERETQRKLPVQLAATILVLLLGITLGCAAEPEQKPSYAEADFKLPVTLNAVMVALVNHAADPVWRAAWQQPETDKDWRELERRAYQLQIAGSLLSVPGTGPMDEDWASDPEWDAWSETLRKTGQDAVEAVRARNLEQISTVGDRLVETCEGCHISFKLALPTGGQFGELSGSPSDPE